MTKLFNPDYLFHLAEKYGMRPSKNYGQNYLINEEVIDRIIEAAELSEDDVVVEVGPGFGVLTERLAESAKQVIAFEIEKRIEPYWVEKTKQFPNVEIVWGNALYQFKNQKSKIKNYKVVANLPYQVTSPLVRMFLESESQPSEMVLMVQKEVGERICAKPGDMSLLAVATQFYAECEYLFTVPRDCFWPSPKVDSAVIRLKVTPRASRGDAAASKVDGKRLFELVRVGFASKRKVLFNNLLPTIGRKNKEELKTQFELLNIGPTARAQELSVSQWVALTKAFPGD